MQQAIWKLAAVHKAPRMEATAGSPQQLYAAHSHSDPARPCQHTEGVSLLIQNVQCRPLDEVFALCAPHGRHCCDALQQSRDKHAAIAGAQCSILQRLQAPLHHAHARLPRQLWPLLQLGQLLPLHGAGTASHAAVMKAE